MDKETKKEFEDLTQIVQKSFGHVAGEITSIKEDLETVKKTMATKEDLKRMATKEDLGKLNIELRDFIDDKLVDLKGDLIVLMRKEDKKLVSLIKILRQKSILTDKETRNILSAEPFPQLLRSKRA